MFDRESESVLEHLHDTKSKHKISKRTGLPVKKVQDVLKMLDKRGIIDMIDLSKKPKNLRSEIHNVVSTKNRPAKK